MKAKKLLVTLLTMMLMVVGVCGCGEKEVEPTVDEEVKYTVRDGFVTDLEDIVTLKYTNNETTISVECEDGAWFYEGDRETWIQQSCITDIIKTAGQMAYNEEIKEVSSLADYGLENPLYTITMVNEDDIEVVLYIGNTEGEDACYVTTGDKSIVYKVSNAIIGMLEFNKDNLLAREDDPMAYLKYLDTTDEDTGYGVETEEDLVVETTEGNTEDTTANPTEDTTTDSTQTE